MPSLSSFVSFPVSPSSYCPSLSLFRTFVPVLYLSPPLFLHRSHRSDIKANLRRRSQAHRAPLARAKPGRVKIKSELICHERAPRLPFYPPRTLRRISAPPARPYARLVADCIYCRLSLSTPLEEFSPHALGTAVSPSLYR